MKRLSLGIICICAAVSSYSQNFAVRTVKNNIFIPWEIIYGPDDNIWFTQKNGYICRVEPATGNTDTLYHETNNVVQSEGGMLGMALHPAFPTQPYVYVAYQYTQGGYKERIARYTYFPGGDTLGAPMTLLDNIDGNNYHNGCRLVVVNDKLFITTGDAGNTSNSQDMNSLSGKILRINLDGSIPSDNPIPGNPAWSWGDRNSQGMTYANGMLYTSMHGGNIEDEINIIEGGRNYGWPTVEGYCDQPGEMTFCNDSNVAEPMYTWSPTIAPAGIDFYDHPMFPQWQNSLMMCSLKDTSLWILKLNSSHDAVVTAIRIDTLGLGRIRDICISPDGSIFLSTSNSQASGNGQKIDRIVELYDSTYIPLKTAQLLKNDVLRIYPNPTQSEFSVSIKNVAITGLPYTIINAVGQVVLEGKLVNNTISLNSLPTGLYQLKLRDATGASYTGKILKE
jgi:glucose/arabinose dehydrogenase